MKGHEYLSIVENRREEGRVRQRTVLYLGRSDKMDPAELSGVLRRYGMVDRRRGEL